ncbi:hypothetical protein [Nocardioides sp.]|uniref:hypothetical protein n=1 Tax=Nocardioides sp. TaxID=35761 RepID=UPI00321AF717
MRLALRRRSGRSSEPPTACFAALLDGHLLWVAVPAVPEQSGRLALCRAGTSDALDLATEHVTDQPGYLGARIELSGLDGVEGRYDVVLARPGRDLERVETSPLPPAAARTSRDPDTQHSLVRTPDGTLRVRTTLLPTAASLLAVRRLDEALELTLTGAGPQLAVLDDDDRVVVSWPVGDDGTAVITRGTVADLEPMTRPVVTGEPASWRPVRRRANDLADPRAGAPLPQVDHPDGDQPLLRLPWTRQGMLQVRVFAREPTGEDEAS